MLPAGERLGSSIYTPGIYFPGVFFFLFKRSVATVAPVPLCHVLYDIDYTVSWLHSVPTRAILHRSRYTYADCADQANPGSAQRSSFCADARIPRQRFRDGFFALEPLPDMALPRDIQHKPP